MGLDITETHIKPWQCGLKSPEPIILANNNVKMPKLTIGRFSGSVKHVRMVRLRVQELKLIQKMWAC